MTLVFIHGAGFTGASFERQTAHFAGSHAPSLPGHCREGAGTSIAGFAADIARYIEEHHLSDVVLCGHSMGGAIALHLVLERMIEPRAMILLGSGARLRVASALLVKMREDFPAAARDIAPYFFAQRNEELVEWAVGTMLMVGSKQTIADFEACDAFDVLERLSELSLPLLSVTGESDVMTPPKYALTLPDRVAGAETRILPGAGHFVMVERPAETNAAIDAFLSRIDSQG